MSNIYLKLTVEKNWCCQNFDFLFKDTLKAFEDFKNKQKSVSSNLFCYVKVYIFRKFIQYTIQQCQKNCFWQN